jgi:hypothetical protein
MFIDHFSASVIADEDNVLLYKVEMTDVNKMLEREPGLAMRFYSKLAQRLAELLLSIHPSASFKGITRDFPVRAMEVVDILYNI